MEGDKFVPYDPTWRDKAADKVAAMLESMGFSKRRALEQSKKLIGGGEGLFGTGLGLADATPLGLLFGAQEGGTLAGQGAAQAMGGAGGGLLDVGLGALAVAPVVGKAGRGGKKVKQTVDAVRPPPFPGIYKDPKVLAEEAMQRWVPESPNLQSLFGVSRADLTDIARGRVGNMPGAIPGAAAKPKGSASADAVMTRANERRLVDQASAAHEYARPMWDDMRGWYVLDPMLERQRPLHGPEAGAAAFNRLNVFGGIESPNLDVITETGRATAANWLHGQGRWDDWVKYGGLSQAEKQRLVDAGIAPADILTVPGRVGHGRSADAMTKFLQTGDHGMQSPKAPLYIDTGGRATPGGLLYQTDYPVGDAHFSRGVGLADARPAKDFAASISTPELQALTPWYRDKVAAPFDLPPAQMQPIQWGLYSPQTGVESPVGAPKLELIADAIARRAGLLGIDPATFRDMVLTGQGHTFSPAGR